LVEPITLDRSTAACQCCPARVNPLRIGLAQQVF
jgi:hypothetical protein